MGSAQSSVNAQDRAILDLKLQRDKLKQYQRRIEVVLDREQALAKQCLATGDKRRALLALKKRKYQQQLLEQTDNHLSTLEQLTRSIEFALVQKDVLSGLENGNKVLSQLNAEMSLDKVERIMDTSAEGIAYQKEVSDMLASNISFEDEEDVLEELRKLEEEQGLVEPQAKNKIENKNSGIEGLSALPKVPQHLQKEGVEKEGSGIHGGQQEPQQERERESAQPMLA